MTYDASKYRLLGIGERIEPTDTAKYNDERGEQPAGVLAGLLVESHDDFVVLRPLAVEPIAKTEFATGATRSDATGRGRFDLIPYEAMLSLAKRYEMGAIHFGPRNWEQGQPLSRLLSSMRRHAHQINYEFSEDHVGAVLWNAAAFVTMVARIEAGILPRELDDIGYFINREASK